MIYLTRNEQRALLKQVDKLMSGRKIQVGNMVFWYNDLNNGVYAKSWDEDYLGSNEGYLVAYFDPIEKEFFDIDAADEGAYEIYEDEDDSIAYDIRHKVYESRNLRESQNITRKELYRLANALHAIDITGDDSMVDESRKLYAEYVSTGVYGLNGALLHDEYNDEYYLIRNRSTNLFKYV